MKYFGFIALSLIVNTASTMAKVPNYVSTEGLIGWWAFNGNANDASQNSNNGTVIGASLNRDRFGNPDRSYFFNGSDGFIKIPLSESLQPRDAMSISLWYNMSSTLEENFVGLVHKYLDSSPSWSSYSIITGNKGLNQGGDLGLTIQTNNIYAWSSVTGMSYINEWAHIIGTYDGSTIKCYKNGVLVSTSSATGQIQYSPYDIEFGRTRNAAGISGRNNYFQGNIDDIGMWNRALSEKEVSDLYNAVESGPRIATATPQIINGFVVGTTITDGGSGYTTAPIITISGGGGTGARAVATVEGGVVTGITILNPGSGYTSTPTLAIASPPFPPRQATGTTEVFNGFVVGVKTVDGGYGYTTPPSVLVVGGGGTGATATATVTDGVVTGITLTSNGSGYTSAPTLQIATPPFDPELLIEVSRVNVRLKVVVGARYQLESSTDMTVWTPTGPSFIAEDAELIQEFVVESPNRYFRIKQVP
jgi:hypothetical protein